MRFLRASTALLLFALPGTAQVLMVADELPAMEVLSKQLATRANLKSTIVTQDAMPPLAPFQAVVVYIHKDIEAQAEAKFIQYASSGGKLVLLHHSISSGKRKNHDWFPFLHIELPPTYEYHEGIDFTLKNLAPDDPVMKGVPAEFEMPDTEVYLNQVLSGEHTLLMGIRYKGIEQSTGAWRMKAGKGTVYYFMAGHNASDFDNPIYAGILSRAITSAGQSYRQ